MRASVSLGKDTTTFQAEIIKLCVIENQRWKYTKMVLRRNERTGMEVKCVSADESQYLIEYKSTSSTVEVMCYDRRTGRGADGYSLKIPGSITDSISYCL